MGESTPFYTNTLPIPSVSNEHPGATGLFFLLALFEKVQAKDSICYANGCKLLFLSAVPAKEEGKESQSRNSEVDSFFD